MSDAIHRLRLPLSSVFVKWISIWLIEFQISSNNSLDFVEFSVRFHFMYATFTSPLNFDIFCGLYFGRYCCCCSRHGYFACSNRWSPHTNSARIENMSVIPKCLIWMSFVFRFVVCLHWESTLYSVQHTDKQNKKKNLLFRFFVWFFLTCTSFVYTYTFISSFCMSYMENQHRKQQNTRKSTHYYMW